MKKYEFVPEDKITFYGETLTRIRLLKDLPGFPAGSLGGYIESETNLSHDGDCWVYDNARVYGDAQVYGDAWVFGDAWVGGDAQVCGDAQVFGKAWICDDARVYENAMVYDNARVYGDAWVGGDAQVCGDAWVGGKARVCGDARVYDNARVGDDSRVLLKPLSEFIEKKDKEISVILSTEEGDVTTSFPIKMSSTAGALCQCYIDQGFKFSVQYT